MRRGFEKVSGYEYVNLPQRKTKQSAGYDIESAVDVVITPGETKLIPTGLKAYMCEYDFKISDNGINSTLVARGPSAVGCIYKNIDCSYVRRLTPLECERLQGLPDNWTEGGRDTARYRAIGNGMAQPCADYVMSKVVEDIKEET